MSKFFRNKMIMLRSILASIPFCLRHLPLRQAVKLPILVYKPKYLSQKGRFVIDCPNVRFGMIRLGFLRCALYPNTGISFKNDGRIVFKGTCCIGNDSYIVCGRQGKIVFGDDFRSKGCLRITSQCGVSFGKSTSVGWQTLIMDTNYHPLWDMEKKKFKRAFSPISIGDYNWIATQCLVMQGVVTPERCIFGARSIITHSGPFESYAVHCGSPLKVLTRNVMRDYEHDHIYDYSL
jgi:Acetyltransferase (isoleucine patch superfamily)